MCRHSLQKCWWKHLEGIRLSHSKTENIKFVGFKPAQYLLSKNLTIAEVKTLFKLRTRMVEVEDNFRNSHTENMWCRLCHLFTENQQHLLECPVIRVNLKDIITFQELDIKMIFGKICNQEKFVKSYHTILQKRNDLVEKDKWMRNEQMKFNASAGLRTRAQFIVVYYWFDAVDALYFI